MRDDLVRSVRDYRMVRQRGIITDFNNIDTNEEINVKIDIILFFNFQF